jgi:hypothetical protein
MKKISLIGFLIIVFISSCEKDETDYRDKYVGEYNFEIRHTQNTYCGGDLGHLCITYSDTGYSYIGSVRKSDTCNNEVIVDWGNDTVIRFRVNPYRGVASISDKTHAKELIG